MTVRTNQNVRRSTRFTALYTGLKTNRRISGRGLPCAAFAIALLQAKPRAVLYAMLVNLI